MIEFSYGGIMMHSKLAFIGVNQLSVFTKADLKLCIFQQVEKPKAQKGRW